MNIEIERKFLVNNIEYRELAHKAYTITQGYLSRERGRTVRVRIRDNKAFITIKSSSVGLARNEYEYEIPKEDAIGLIKMCPPPVLSKTRYLVNYCGNTWEVDEFHGEFEGTVVAEIELKSEDQEFEKPGFVGQEVTGDHRYSNSRMGQVIEK